MENGDLTAIIVSSSNNEIESKLNYPEEAILTCYDHASNFLNSVQNGDIVSPSLVLIDSYILHHETSKEMVARGIILAMAFADILTDVKFAVFNTNFLASSPLYHWCNEEDGWKGNIYYHRGDNLENLISILTKQEHCLT